MKTERLHIVSFDIPYPANYGGAIDVYYKLVALKASGIKVVLHCTYKGDLRHYLELESLCEKVYYYKRDMSVRQQFALLPYAVKGRVNEQLLANLSADNDPILFEGLVSCFYMNHPALKNRVKVFRECNVEHDYYNGLAKASTSLINKIYYRIEAIKLKKFEPIIQNADCVFAVSHQDEEHYKTTYPQLPTYYLPSFHHYNEVVSKAGRGDYVLYHGNLALAENIKAAKYICEQVVPKLPDISFVFAGRQPSSIVKQLVESLPNATLVADPSDKEMNDLVQNAQVNFLITHQPTGLKLKLLNVLYAGRFVLTNSLLTHGTELAQLCVEANTAAEQAQQLKTLMNTDFSEDNIAQRKQLLLRTFDNKEHCRQLLQIIDRNL